jgi:hypothetical protein
MRLTALELPTVRSQRFEPEIKIHISPEIVFYFDLYKQIINSVVFSKILGVLFLMSLIKMLNYLSVTKAHP